MFNTFSKNSANNIHKKFIINTNTMSRFFAFTTFAQILKKYFKTKFMHPNEKKKVLLF